MNPSLLEKPVMNDAAHRWLLAGENGGAREDRTPDLLRARQALSQLSYGPTDIGGSGWI